MPTSALDRFEHVAMGIKGFFSLMDIIISWQQLAQLHFCKPHPWTKNQHDVCLLLEITNHNFLFANKKVGAHSMFGKGHGTGRLTCLLANTCSGKRIGEQAEMFFSLYYPVFSVLIAI